LFKLNNASYLVAYLDNTNFMYLRSLQTALI